MATRRSHQKSRRGCLNCKRRHVKCDEAIPCKRCSDRGDACGYASPSIGPSQTSSGAEPDSSYDSALITEFNFPAHRRLLELQLMHRWSTETYKSCTTPGSDDDEVWQYLVPKLAFEDEFLLNGLFALTAFEIARLTKKNDYEKYVNAALEYHTLALGSFRSQLPRITTERHEASLCFSLMLMVFALASAQFVSKPSREEQGGMVQTAITVFELLRGSIPIAESKEGYIAENPYIRKLKRFEDLPKATLDKRTEDALAKLGDLNDSRISSSMRDSDKRRVQQIARWEACKKALAFLRQCFERCVDRTSEGYALGWLNMAGESYVEAVKSEDDTALLVLALWGVLVDRLGRQVWWTQKFGRLLVEEILDGAVGRKAAENTRDASIVCLKELMLDPSSEGSGRP